MIVSALADKNIRAGNWVSWNANITHGYDVLTPIRSEAQLAELIAGAKAFRPVGTGQSSSDIVAGTSVLADMNGYDNIISIDSERMQIRAQSGILLKDLLQTAEAQGWTIPCLPDNDSITLGGAIATGTHGTTGGGKPLSEYMVACSLISPDGSIEEVHEGDARMDALRCSMGLLGVMSEITLQCEASRNLYVTEEAVRDEIWLEKWPHWLKENYFLRLLWIPHSGYAWVIRGNPVESSQTPGPIIDAPGRVKHRRELSRLLYSIDSPGFSRFSNKLLRQLFFSHKSSSLGSLYQATVTKKRSSTLELAEWTVGQENFNAVFREFVQAMAADKEAFAHIPMDIRFLNGDNTWLSNAYGKDIVTMGCVTRNPSKADEYRAFDIIESSFLKAGGRPHWAKRFNAGRETLSGLYPRWDDFIQARRDTDPQNVFLNGYLGGLFS